MQYDWESAYRILAAMEKYPGPNVPSPDVELDEDTGLPPSPPSPRVSWEPVMAQIQDIDYSVILEDDNSARMVDTGHRPNHREN